jgi:hypothetical protein
MSVRKGEEERVGFRWWDEEMEAQFIGCPWTIEYSVAPPQEMLRGFPVKKCTMTCNFL